MEGVKYDGGKDRWDLLPWEEVRSVVRVLTLGAEKYDDDNWKKVANSRNRYFAAAQRHITAWWDGERWDQESGIHHLAHAICCLLFAMWHDHNEVSRSDEETVAPELSAKDRHEQILSRPETAEEREGKPYWGRCSSHQ